MSDGQKVLLVGGVAVGAIVLFAVMKASNQRAYAMQRAAIAQQGSGSTVNDILSGVSIGSSVLSSIEGLFSGFGNANDPGMEPVDSSGNEPGMVDSFGGSNDPGLDTYDDL